MIKKAKRNLTDRESLIARLRESAASVVRTLQLRSDEEMEELAERDGVSYISRMPTPEDLDDDLDDDLEFDEAAAGCAEVPLLFARPEPEEPLATPQSSPRPAETSAANQNNEAADSPLRELKELVSKAKNGDNEAVKKISKYLDANPALWQSVGDLSEHSEQLLITVIADGNTLVSESMQREMHRLKSELAEGETPNALERMTIQRVVAAWLMCQYTDRATLVADASGSKAAAWGKRQEWAEKRYQAAIKSLDLTRRLTSRKKSSAKAPAAAAKKECDTQNQPKARPAAPKAVQTAQPDDAVSMKTNRETPPAPVCPVNRIGHLAAEPEPVN